MEILTMCECFLSFLLASTPSKHCFRLFLGKVLLIGTILALYNIEVENGQTANWLL